MNIELSSVKGCTLLQQPRDQRRFVIRDETLCSFGGGGGRGGMDSLLGHEFVLVALACARFF